MIVSLSSMPDPPKEYIVNFDRLDGGLNTWELDYRLDRNQSPDMKNMWWLDGALCCRDGQTRVTGDSVLGAGYSAYELPFWDCFFYHIGTKLYRSPVPAADAQPGEVTLTELYSGVPENRGTWFRYEDSLFYKNRGAYLKIDYDAEDESFQAAPVTPYDPIIQINTEPTTAAGDAYQPENRLSPTKTVWYSTVSGVKEYHLPVQDVDSVDSVVVDGDELTAETDYTVDLEAGTVTFTTEPEHHDPVQVNTVKITYTKENQDAYDSVMDCPYAAVYGGNQNVCVVVGGCPAQPNAYYWCGNHIVMDPGYFPMEQYNFAGDTEESITGFGKQQSMLVIFKQHSIGRADISTTEMASGRVMITMDYTNINSRIGCDLPWTIQLVENNLVFCNTEQGVHIVKDSSAAYENNVVSLSRNVNGTAQRPGLLAAVRAAANVESFDDDRRYWVVADGEAYVWDYTLSGYSEPSWFYFTGILGVAFMKHNENGFHLDAQGRLSAFRRDFADYGGPIEKRFQFAAQSMGSYDNLKDVTRVILAVRADTDTKIRVFYESDYEEREDLTPVLSYSWRLAPRNLEYRYLGVRKFLTVAIRKPGCRHVRHFGMRLENAETGNDMSVVSAQIFYRYQGRDR